MRYDPATRVLSLSFTRDPVEHADVMLEAGRRMTTSTDPVSAWTGLGVAVGFGAIVGIVMEIHRRVILPMLLGPSEIAPLGTVTLQLLPVILLILALYVAIYRRAVRRRRNALISRIQPNTIVDVDIFADGMHFASGQLAFDIDWPAVTSIVLDANRIEIECDSFATYLPDHAFANKAAFAETGKVLRRLWRDAAKHDHDRRMVAAGLD
jgi:hypothetical protein